MVWCWDLVQVAARKRSSPQNFRTESCSSLLSHRHLTPIEPGLPGTQGNLIDKSIQLIHPLSLLSDQMSNRSGLGPPKTKAAECHSLLTMSFNFTNYWAWDLFRTKPQFPDHLQHTKTMCIYVDIIGKKGCDATKWISCWSPSLLMWTFVVGLTLSLWNVILFSRTTWHYGTRRGGQLWNLAMISTTKRNLLWTD